MWMCGDEGQGSGIGDRSRDVEAGGVGVGIREGREMDGMWMGLHGWYMYVVFTLCIKALGALRKMTQNMCIFFYRFGQPHIL